MYWFSKCFIDWVKDLLIEEMIYWLSKWFIDLVNALLIE